MEMRDRKRFLAAMISVMMAASACSGITVFAAETDNIDIVTIEGGQVQGVESDTEGVKVFKGIPFAADTSGENRWKAPQAAETWDGIKVCDTWGDQAMQN